jgi:hypothetical protein
MRTDLTQFDERAIAAGVDPKVLAEVGQNCVLVGNRVELDSAWLARKIAMAALDGAREGARKPPQLAFLELANVPGNVARVVHGREHRDRVVRRMDKFDVDVGSVHDMVARGEADELDVQIVVAQVLAGYFADIDGLWNAYVARYRSPLSGQVPAWPC